MNRLYAVETMMSPTGSLADHRLSRRPSEIYGVLAAIVAELAGMAGRHPARTERGLARRARPARRAGGSGADGRHRARSGAEHRRCGGDPGEWLPPEVHALSHLCNTMLHAEGLPHLHRADAARPRAREQDLPSLAREIEADRVDTLVMLEGNPVYTAPADLELGRLSARVPHSVHLGRVRGRDGGGGASGSSRCATPSSPGATRGPTTARSRSSSR